MFLYEVPAGGRQLRIAAMASLEKYRLAAKGKIAEVVDDYIAGGAGDQPQQNVDGFKK